MIVKTNTLTPGLFLELFSSVGWEPPCIGQVRTALEHTLATFTAYDGKQLVGIVRLIGDDSMSFYIKDFAVIPDYQSKAVDERCGTIYPNRHRVELGRESQTDQHKGSRSVLS